LGILIRHQPARTVKLRVSLCYVWRVCKKCAGRTKAFPEGHQDRSHQVRELITSDNINLSELRTSLEAPGGAWVRGRASRPRFRGRDGARPQSSLLWGVAGRGNRGAEIGRFSPPKNGCSWAVTSVMEELTGFQKSPVPAENVRLAILIARSPSFFSVTCNLPINEHTEFSDSGGLTHVPVDRPYRTCAPHE
jgi:hypothetical protein